MGLHRARAGSAAALLVATVGGPCGSADVGHCPYFGETAYAAYPAYASPDPSPLGTPEAQDALRALGWTGSRASNWEGPVPASTRVWLRSCLVEGGQGTGISARAALHLEAYVPTRDPTGVAELGKADARTRALTTLAGVKPGVERALALPAAEIATRAQHWCS